MLSKFVIETTPELASREKIIDKKCKGSMVLLSFWQGFGGGDGEKGCWRNTT